MTVIILTSHVIISTSHIHDLVCHHFDFLCHNYYYQSMFFFQCELHRNRVNSIEIIFTTQVSSDQYVSVSLTYWLSSISCRALISLRAWFGIPSSSFRKATFFKATVSPVWKHQQIKQCRSMPVVRNRVIVLYTGWMQVYTVLPRCVWLWKQFRELLPQSDPEYCTDPFYYWTTSRLAKQKCILVFHSHTGKYSAT